MEALKTEINRIADSSNFNGIKLLDGSMDGAGTEVINDVTVTAVADGDQSGAAGAAGVYSFDIKDMEVKGAAGATQTMVTFGFGGTSIGVTVSLTDGKADADTIAAAVSTALNGGLGVTINNAAYTISIDGTKVTLTQQKAPTSTNEIMTSTNMKVTITDRKSVV